MIIIIIIIERMTKNRPRVDPEKGEEDDESVVKIIVMDWLSSLKNLSKTKVRTTFY